MPNHLLILNGPEKRDFIVEKAIKVCLPHFDKIAIVQSGKIKGHTNPIIDRYVIHSSDEFIPHVDSYAHLASTVSIGDRFLILDSDEVPTQELIEFVLNGDIYGNMCYTWYMHHHISDTGQIYHISDSTNGFAAFRVFIKEDGLSVITNGGGHQMFYNLEQRQQPGNGHINHIKHQFAIYLSSFAYCMPMPLAHGITVESGDLEIVNDVTKRYGITPSFVYQNFQDKELFRKLKKELADIKFLDIPKAIDFILSTDKDLSELYTHDPCVERCCRYV